MATASIRTNTLAFLGTGTGFSTKNNCSGLPSTQARMRSGIGILVASDLTPAWTYKVSHQTAAINRTASGTGSGAFALCRYSTVVNSKSVLPMFSTA